MFTTLLFKWSPPPWATTEGVQKKERERERKRERERDGEGEREREKGRGTTKKKYREINMTRGAPFKCKQGL